MISFPPRPIVAGSGMAVRVSAIMFFRVASPGLCACNIRGPVVTVRGLSTAALEGVVNSVRLSRALASHRAVGAGVETSLSRTASP